MTARGQGAVSGAMAGAKSGGWVGGLIGGALGLMQGDKMQGQLDQQNMQNAWRQGQQEMADMRNGLEMDANDRAMIASAVDGGYGGY